MRRRDTLRIGAALATSGIGGCLARTGATDADPTVVYDGLYLYVRPNIVNDLPTDAEVVIEQGGTELYRETHTIPEMDPGPAVHVSQQWMPEPLTGTVTVSTGIHGTRSVDLETLKPREQQFDTDTVAIIVFLQQGSMTVKPIPL